jgi:uncharacterized protein
MRIFIDIGHPAHVHYFKNAINILENKGHEFLITARNKDVAISLLKYNKFKFYNRGKGANGILGKFFYLFRANIKLLKLAKKFKPDIFLSFTSPYVAQVSKIIGKPHISFDDTEHAKLGILSFAPFTESILTPKCFTKDFGKKHIRFDGYMELCYLHPNYYKPDQSILNLLNVQKDEKYVILRFVSWKANHDIGHKGLLLENKILAVKEFSKYAKVFVSSEGKLPETLDKYHIDIPPERMHDALAFTELLFGESSTMASECSILGTPSIFIDNDGRGYTFEQEKSYSLVHNFTESAEDQRKAIAKGIEILKSGKSHGNFKASSLRLINDKIDVNRFMVWYIENYPKSDKIMKDNPDYQYRFK